MNIITRLLACVILGSSPVFANQTTDLSPIQPVTGLPFRINIEKMPLELPVGLHSGVVGIYRGLWVFIAGRTNGLHGFDTDPFPPSFQNTSIYVVDPAAGQVYFRSLTDPAARITQQQIDTLSVTSPQGCQDGNTLYMSGGYGINTTTNTFGTMPVLTAINLPGIVQWVMHPENPSLSVAQNIRQVYHSAFQITGGAMFKSGSILQLIFGQNFVGVYTDNSNGIYSEQIRRIKINDIPDQLSVTVLPSKPAMPSPNYRRRDLNVVPTMLNTNNTLHYGFVAYAGVFTLDTGVWTVPVVINESGDAHMADPNLPSSFKQGMNHYVSATASLYSRKYASTFHIFLGGISYGYYSGGTFQTDAEIPFINQVTTVKMDKNGNFTQYLMNNEYPVILSTHSNPGNRLLFGAGARFISSNILRYPNEVINLDAIRKPTVIGYIVGGIQSTLANTNNETDSAASPYVFRVTLTPVPTVMLK